MRFSIKILGDIVLFIVFLQAFVLLCCEEQILQSTRILGALEDENERLNGLIIQQKCALESQKNFHQVLQCAHASGINQPIPYQDI